MEPECFDHWARWEVTVTDGRFRLRCCHPAIWTKHKHRLWFWSILIHYVKTWRHPQTARKYNKYCLAVTGKQSLPQVTCTEHSVKFGDMVFTERRYARLALYAVVVCPSVRPSVYLSFTRRYCTKTAKCRIMQTTLYDIPWTLVFWRQRFRRNSTESGSPQRGEGRQPVVGYATVGDFRPISRYIPETVQDRDIVNTER